MYYYISLIILLYIVLYMMTIESYCEMCGDRVQRAQVYAHPDYLSGLGWVL
jgi:hypothetical protein